MQSIIRDIWNIVKKSVKKIKINTPFGLSPSGPVYTGPDKFLHGQISYLDRLFTWIRANFVTDCSGVYTEPCKF